MEGGKGVAPCAIDGGAMAMLRCCDAASLVAVAKGFAGSYRKKCGLLLVRWP